MRLVRLLRVDADPTAVRREDGGVRGTGRRRLDAAEQQLEVLRDVLADPSAEPDDRALRPVPPVEVREERVPRGAAHCFLRADDVPAERLVAVEMTLPDVADVGARRVGVHVHLLDDHALLAVDLVGVEPGVTEHVDEDVERDVARLGGALHVVARQLLARERVELPAYGVDLRRDVACRGPPFGSLEEHVLGEVRDAALLAPLVARAGREHHEARDRLRMRQRGSEDPRPVGERVAFEGRHAAMLDDGDPTSPRDHQAVE